MNDVVRQIHTEVQALDGEDSAAIQAREVLIEAKDNAEADLAAAIIVARELLGSKDPSVLCVLGSATDPGQLIDIELLSAWSPLSEALKVAAMLKEEEPKVTLPFQISGHSGRKKAKALADAKDASGRSAELKGAASNLDAALSATYNARAAISEHDAKMEAADVEGGLGKKGGVLTALHRKLMNDHGISPQQYWNGTLTGNHCREYLQCHREILGKLRDAIETTHAKATGDLFFARFSSVLKELDVIGHYARATRFLTDAELDALEASCTAFGVASRATFGKMLTCKGHLIKKHLQGLRAAFVPSAYLGRTASRLCTPWIPSHGSRRGRCGTLLQGTKQSRRKTQSRRTTGARIWRVVINGNASGCDSGRCGHFLYCGRGGH